MIGSSASGQLPGPRERDARTADMKFLSVRMIPVRTSSVHGLGTPRRLGGTVEGHTKLLGNTGVSTSDAETETDPVRTFATF